MMEPGGNEEAFALAAIFVVLGLFALFSLVVGAVVAYFLYAPLKRVPERHRQIEPWTAFLMLIPLVGFVMMWILLPFKVPESLRSFFDEVGGEDVGDCGKNLGLTTAICMTASFVPLIGYLAGLVGLVTLVLYLIKVNGIGGRIPYNA